MDLKDLKSLITYANTVIKSGASEITLEVDNVKVTIKADALQEKPSIDTNPVLQQIPLTQPQQHVVQPSTAPLKESYGEEERLQEETVSTDSGKNYVEIKSPMIGTFYRKPSPDKETFVHVGDDIEPGTVVCVIEAMKLFNEIESEISGKIVKVLVEDGTPVEYDQPLFLIDPS